VIWFGIRFLFIIRGNSLFGRGSGIASFALIRVVRLVVSVPEAARFRSVGKESLVLDAFDVAVAKADLVPSEVPSLRRLHFGWESAPLCTFSD